MRVWFGGVLLVISLFLGCHSLYQSTGEVVEEEYRPKELKTYRPASPRKGYVTRPTSRFERQFDFNRNGRLEPEERNRLGMARGYFKEYAPMWKNDKDKNWRIDKEEYESGISDE